MIFFSCRPILVNFLWINCDGLKAIVPWNVKRGCWVVDPRILSRPLGGQIGVGGLESTGGESTCTMLKKSCVCTFSSLQHEGLWWTSAAGLREDDKRLACELFALPPLVICDLLAGPINFNVISAFLKIWMNRLELLFTAPIWQNIAWFRWFLGDVSIHDFNFENLIR